MHEWKAPLWFRASTTARGHKGASIRGQQLTRQRRIKGETRSWAARIGLGGKRAGGSGQPQRPGKHKTAAQEGALSRARRVHAWGQAHPYITLASQGGIRHAVEKFGLGERGLSQLRARDAQPKGWVRLMCTHSITRMHSLLGRAGGFHRKGSEGCSRAGPPAPAPVAAAAVLAAKNCCRMPMVSLRMLFTSAAQRVKGKGVGCRCVCGVGGDEGGCGVWGVIVRPVVGGWVGLGGERAGAGTACSTPTAPRVGALCDQPTGNPGPAARELQGALLGSPERRPGSGRLASVRHGAQGAVVGCPPDRTSSIVGLDEGWYSMQRSPKICRSLQTPDRRGVHENSGHWSKVRKWHLPMHRFCPAWRPLSTGRPGSRACQRTVLRSAGTSRSPAGD